MTDLIGEAERRLRAIKVSPHQIVVAKAVAYSMAKATRGRLRSDAIVQKVLTEQGAPLSGSIFIRNGSDAEGSIAACEAFLTWTVATREAILELIWSGTLVALREFLSSSPQVKYSVQTGGSGSSSGWDFPEYDATVPYEVRLAESRRNSNDAYLYDSSLYLNLLNTPGMHADVSAAFSEAIKCFRLELYSAAMAMLGKASEDAWLELGAALVQLADKRAAKGFDKHKQTLDSPMAGVKKKIEAVSYYYQDQHTFQDLGGSTGIKPDELRIVAEWSDTVRDSRNTIHFGISPVTPNTFEKVSVLLLGAPQYIRVLYRIKAAADAQLP